MSSFNSLMEGFASALTLNNLLFGLLGTILGTLVGVLPGIGPALAIALLLPITYSVSPASALIMFAAIYYGAMYGGSTTSILLNTPGESGSVITALEGHQMAKRGRAGSALATAAIGSFIAGTIATAILAFTAPSLAEWAFKVTAADFFALMLIAFTTVGTLLGNSMLRGMASLGVGLVIGLVGSDLQSGAVRLTFGSLQAIDGIETVTVIVSLFALGEALYIAGGPGEPEKAAGAPHGVGVAHGDEIMETRTAEPTPAARCVIRIGTRVFGDPLPVPTERDVQLVRVRRTRAEPVRRPEEERSAGMSKSENAGRRKSGRRLDRRCGTRSDGTEQQ